MATEPSSRNARVYWRGALVNTPAAIAFGPFCMDIRAGLLLRGRDPIALRPKTWSVLRYLAERPGALVTKQELLEAIWADAVVNEVVLSGSIWELRVALGDSSRASHVIQTVQGRGFRFIAPVHAAPAASASGAHESPSGQQWDLATATGDSSSRDEAPAVPFVGRDEEVRRLAGLLAQARAGRRQAAFIIGPAGIGKTALVEAFLTSPEVRGRAGAVSVARGFCVEQLGPREPYMPVLEALGRLTHRADAGGLGELLGRVAPTWLAQTPWLIGEEDNAQALERSPQFVRPERMLREFAVLMEALTADQPLVLVLEDLHWSDPSTVDLLSVLGEREETARLLVIGTYRSDEAVVHEHPVLHAARTLQGRHRCVEVALSDLPVEGVEDYLQARFPGSDFPSKLAPRIHQETDGNPLFVVGAVDSLVVRGHILDTGAGWALPAPLETINLDMPDSVRLLIESQFDSVSPADRAVLQAASCAGEDFSPLVVAAALGQDVADTETHCEGLARARCFLRAAGHIEWPDHHVSPRYAFTHELYRQVVYGQVTDGQCMRLHQRIGQALEAAYGARRMEVAPRLAVHFERGRDDGRAVTYLAAAAAGARKRFANRETIGYLEAALAITARAADDGARRRRELDLRLALGSALSDTHGWAAEQVLRNYERASELCADMGSPPQRSEILYARWYAHGARGERHDTVATAAALKDLARRRGTVEDRLLADSVMVRTMVWDGRFVDAHHYAQRYLTRRAGRRVAANPIAYGPDPLLAATDHDATALWFLGHPEQAQTSAEAAVRRARESGHPFTLAAMLYHTARIHLLCRDTARGRDLAAESASVSAEHGFAVWHAVASLLSGWALVQEGRASEGNGIIERAFSAIEATGTRFYSTFAHACLAEGRMGAGLFAEALAAADAGLALSRNTIDRSHEPELWRLKGEVLLRADSPQAGGQARRSREASPRRAGDAADGRGSEAETCFQHALKLARASRARSLELRAATSLARAWHARGRTADAGRLLGGICRWFGAGAEGPDLAEARALLGQLRNPEVARHEAKPSRPSARR